MRANLAVLIFSLRKKEACFLNSWNKGLLMLLLLFLFKRIRTSKDQNLGCKKLSSQNGVSKVVSKKIAELKVNVRRRIQWRNLRIMATQGGSELG